jgi:hypothetical protein
VYARAHALAARAAVAQAAWVRLAHDALAARRRHEGHVDRVDEAAHRVGVTARTTTEHEERPARGREDLRGLADRLGIDGIEATKAAEPRDPCRRGRRGAVLHRHHDERGAGPIVSTRRVQSGQRLRARGLGPSDADLHARRPREELLERHALGTAVLREPPARRGPGDVARDHDHRDALEARVHHPGDRGGGAGARRHEHRRDLTRRAKPSRRLERRGGLLTRLDEPRAVDLVERLEERSRGAAGHPEVGTDPRPHKARDQRPRRAYRLGLGRRLGPEDLSDVGDGAVAIVVVVRVEKSGIQSAPPFGGRRLFHPQPGDKREVATVLLVAVTSGCLRHRCRDRRA